MSMTYTARESVGITKAGRRLRLAAVVVLAGLVVSAVAYFLPPLTEGERAEMLIDALEGLPQDR